VTPLGWYWALLVWGYALAWALVNDRVKLIAYRIIGAPKGALPRQAKVESRTETKAEAPLAPIPLAAE
jgi:H+-transporting ATPase